MRVYLYSLIKAMSKAGAFCEDRYAMREIDSVYPANDENNKFIAVIGERKYPAIFNKTVGAYFVDDVHGEVNIEQ